MGKNKYGDGNTECVRGYQVYSTINNSDINSVIKQTKKKNM